MKTTSSRTKGNKYKIENLIKELIEMQKQGVKYIDIEVIDEGYMDIEMDKDFNEVKETWIEHVEYKFFNPYEKKQSVSVSMDLDDTLPF